MADGAQGAPLRAPRTTGVYLHLDHALRILKAEPDYRKWGPLIERVPDTARDEVRDWLYVVAQKIRAFQRWQAAQPQAGLF